MRITFWVIILTISLLASVGQAVYIIYFVGDQVGEYSLVENGQPNATDPFEITQDQLPVRLNIVVRGDRDTIGGNGDSIASIGRGEFEISTGGPAAEDTQLFKFSANEDNDVSRISLTVGQVTVGQDTVQSRVKLSRVLQEPTAGTWQLSAQILDQSRFALQNLDVTVITNAGIVNMTVMIPAIIIAILSIIMLIVALRRRYPDAAT